MASVGSATEYEAADLSATFACLLHHAIRWIIYQIMHDVRVAEDVVESVRAALAELPADPRDEAARNLAERYALRIDIGGEDELSTYGPKLLAVLDALGLTPKARAVAMKGGKVDARRRKTKPRRRATRPAGRWVAGAAAMLELPRSWGLTPPETSYGFDLIDFARDTLATPFDPWQEWLAIHVGELLPDGRPRFRTVLILVARQNGKTTFGEALVLYWLFIERTPLVLGTSTDRSYAKRTWSSICDAAADNEWLNCDLGPKALRLTIGEEALKTKHDAEYIFAANNGRAGRSTTLHRWLADELREHRTRAAWDSASKAMNAVFDAQTVAITNQGDSESVVLDSLRAPAIQFIETGEGDHRLGLFEWSAPDGADPTNVDALAAANSNLGHRLDPEALQADAAAREGGGRGGTDGVPHGGAVPARHAHGPGDRAGRLEGQRHGRAARPRRVPALRGAVRGRGARRLTRHAGGRRRAGRRDPHGGRRALGRLRLHEGVARRAAGHRAPREAAGAAAGSRTARPPRSLPTSPRRRGRGAGCGRRAGSSWWRSPPRRPRSQWALAEVVRSGELVHPKDPLQTAHVEAAQKLWHGDRWVFVRRGTGAIDGAYATAGAVHLARTLPPPRSPLVAV